MTVAPLTLREAADWAALHQPTDTAALDALRPAGKLNATKLAARIRALALVGGAHALDVLAAFGNPGGQWPDAVAHELLAAWSRFDRRAFARRVFALNEHLFLQHAGVVDSLEGIEDVPLLSELTAAVEKRCSLEPLARCDRLRSLVLNLSGGTGYFSPLGRCPKLRSLDLWNVLSLTTADASLFDEMKRRGVKIRR